MRKYTFKFLVFFGLLLFPFMVFSKPVDTTTGKIVAKNLFVERYNLSKKENIKAEDISANLAFVKQKEEHNIYYVFNINDIGFVMVSADDNVKPVLGYSLNHNYTGENMPPALQDLLEYYSEQIEYAIDEMQQPSKKLEEEWDRYKNGSNVTKNGIKNVNPLTDHIEWGQGQYYNDQCPYDPDGPDNHALVGCVATAMGIIMKYYEYPISGDGSHGYDHDNYDPDNCDNNNYYGYLYADFSAAYYDWYEMENSLNSYNDEVAKLLYHCGVSVEMCYGTTVSLASSTDARDALVNNFNYSGSAEYYEKDNYTESEWENALQSQLDESKPVFYSGSDQNNENGHAFVCDGYQDSEFHFNWGWSGDGNGYFTLSNLTPGAGTEWESDFSYNQAAILHITPNDFCLNCNENFPSGTHETESNSLVTVSEYMYGGDYAYFNVSAGETYKWTTCSEDENDTQLTLFEGNSCGGFNFAYNDDDCGLQSTIEWTAPPSYSGTVTLLLSEYDCSNSTNFSTLEWACTSCSPSKNEIISNSDIKIFPNPANNIVNIENAANARISIVNMVGQEVISTVATSKRETVNISGLSNGVYIIRIKDDEEVIVTKKLNVVK